MCKSASIETPLTPYLDIELLRNNALALDGSHITTTGFEYGVPKLTAESLRQQIQVYIEQKLFPPIL